MNQDVKKNNQLFKLIKNKKNLIFSKSFPTILKERFIQTEKNTRKFIVLLEGQLSIFMLNPSQKEEVKKNSNLLSNSNLKFMEVKLYAEQVLHIPYGWHYAWKCLDKCKILEVNSETLVTLPIKFFQDKIIKN